MTRQPRGGALLAIGLALGLTIGSGVAVAAPLTEAAVKKIVKKQVKKAAPSLTVGNADKLGGAPPSAYLKTAGVRIDGVATSGDIALTPSGTFTTVLTKTVTAPTDGYVQITASLSTLKGGGPGGTSAVDYNLMVDGTPLTTDTEYHSIVTNDTIYLNSGSISAVVAVTKGSHTFALRVREQGIGSTLRGRDLSIVFAPTGSAPVLPY